MGIGWGGWESEMHELFWKPLPQTYVCMESGESLFLILEKHHVKSISSYTYRPNTLSKALLYRSHHWLWVWNFQTVLYILVIPEHYAPPYLSNHQCLHRTSLRFFGALPNETRYKSNRSFFILTGLLKFLPAGSAWRDRNPGSFWWPYTAKKIKKIKKMKMASIKSHECGGRIEYNDRTVRGFRVPIALL